jgi:hypothetical protein
MFEFQEIQTFYFLRQLSLFEQIFDRLRRGDRILLNLLCFFDFLGPGLLLFFESALPLG